ncbi:MAG: DUF503 domain-containing protein [Bryobacter sp.]|nr:DUF503 domain-containing protein [Bryobacter sp.]
MPALGIITFELHLPEAHSLKDKRHWVLGLKEKLRKRHNLAVAEIDYQDIWNRGLVSAVTVSNQRAQCQKVLEAAERTAASFLGPFLVEVTYEYL